MAKPRSPQGPKRPSGFRAVPPPPKIREGRPSGNSVVYDVDREHDYPLQIPRYQRSTDIFPLRVVGGGSALNQDEINALKDQGNFSAGDRYDFWYASDRSDKGYWIVSLEALNPVGAYPPWLQDIINQTPIPPGYAPVALVYLCNCPDFAREQYRYLSKFSLEVGQRDWSASEAGCDRAQGCKHVYAARRYLSDQLPLPQEDATTTPGAVL